MNRELTMNVERQPWGEVHVYLIEMGLQATEGWQESMAPKGSNREQLEHAAMEDKCKLEVATNMKNIIL